MNYSPEKNYLLYNLLKWFSVNLMTWILRCLQNRKPFSITYHLQCSIQITFNIIFVYAHIMHSLWYRHSKSLKEDSLSTTNSTQYLFSILVWYASFHLHIILCSIWFWMKRVFYCIKWSFYWSCMHFIHYYRPSENISEITSGLFISIWWMSIINGIFFDATKYKDIWKKS